MVNLVVARDDAGIGAVGVGGAVRIASWVKWLLAGVGALRVRRLPL